MINNLHIKNFKAFEEVELEFSNLNILTGLNGMGKSSIIQVLNLIRNAAVHEGNFPNISLNTKNLSLGNVKNAIYQYAKEDFISFNLEFDNKYFLNLKYNYDSFKDYLPISIESSKTLNDDKKPYQEEALFQNKCFQYLQADLVSPEDSYGKNDYLIDKFDSIGNKGEYSAQYLNQLGRKKISIKRLRHEKSKSDTLMENLNQWLQEISPGVRINVTEFNNNIKMEAAFRTKTEYTDNFSTKNIGFGIIYSIPIILSLLLARKDKLIIIENPEAHLHPKAQSAIGRLAALAAEAGAQIILETHSDHIINGIRVATKRNEITHEKIKLYYFDRTIESARHFSYVHEMNIDKDGRIDHWPDGFLDEWDKNLMELI